MEWFTIFGLTKSIYKHECDVICSVLFSFGIRFWPFRCLRQYYFVFFCTFKKSNDNRTEMPANVLYRMFVSIYSSAYVLLLHLRSFSSEYGPNFYFNENQRTPFVYFDFGSSNKIALLCLLLSLLPILKWVCLHEQQTDSRRICIANQTATDRTVVNEFIESNCIGFYMELIHSTMTTTTATKTTTTKNQNKSKNNCFARSSFECALWFFNRKIDKIVLLQIKWIEEKSEELFII